MPTPGTNHSLPSIFIGIPTGPICVLKVDLKLIDNSVQRLLMEKFELGLFENPYVDEVAAEKIVGSAKFQERADLAHRKSIVLLRNETKALPLKPKTTSVIILATHSAFSPKVPSILCQRGSVARSAIYMYPFLRPTAAHS